VSAAFSKTSGVACPEAMTLSWFIAKNTVPTINAIVSVRRNTGRTTRGTSIPARRSCARDAADAACLSDDGEAVALGAASAATAATAQSIRARALTHGAIGAHHSNEHP